MEVVVLSVLIMEVPDPSCFPTVRDPRRLSEFGYGFNAAGELRNLVTGRPFVFLSQKHYDLLGDALVSELYHKLEAEFGFSRVQVPLDADVAEPSIPIFVSANAPEAETVLIINQGSGAVRPGMWARALCMNDTLERGAVFSYIREAFLRRWAVIILNPNENRSSVPTAPVLPARDDEPLTLTEQQERWLNVSKVDWARQVMASREAMKVVRGSGSPEEHLLYAYQHVIPRTFPLMKRLLIVAHSYGGKCVTNLIRHELLRSPETASRLSGLVPAIALTDAINDLARWDRVVVKDFFRSRVVNWVASEMNLDVVCPFGPARATEISAGHTDHIHTSASCVRSVFQYFDDVIGNNCESPYLKLLARQ